MSAPLHKTNIHSFNKLRNCTTQDRSIDGSSFYNVQSRARDIKGKSDVDSLARADEKVFARQFGPHLPADRNAAIYEAATGPGILQTWLLSKGYLSLHGSDFSENEAKIAQLINPEIRHANSITDLENRFPTGTLDSIIALDFYEHVEREAFMQFLRAASSSLKPGGKLILRGPNGDSPFVGLNLYNDPTHVWAYTTTSLSSLLRGAGFTSIHFSDDTYDSIHEGSWWKRPLMSCSQAILRMLTRAAIRKDIRFWGMSLYVYATK